MVAGRCSVSVFLDGQQLRAAREARKLTLQDVADQAGVTRQYVGSVEYNKVQLIPPGVARITQAVGLGIRFYHPSESEEPLHFFTYGSMKPGFSRYGVVEASGPEGQQQALLAGYKLYDTRMDYPALVRTRRPTDLIQGTLFRFTPATITKALKLFDVIEGVDDEPPLFVRRRAVAITADPANDDDEIAMPCWLYLYDQSVDGMTYVKEGIWQKK